MLHGVESARKGLLLLGSYEISFTGYKLSMVGCYFLMMAFKRLNLPPVNSKLEVYYHFPASADIFLMILNYLNFIA